MINNPATIAQAVGYVAKTTLSAGLGGFTGIVIGGMIGSRLGFEIGKERNGAVNPIVPIAGMVLGASWGGFLGAGAGIFGLSTITYPLRAVMGSIASTAANINISGALVGTGHAASAALGAASSVAMPALITAGCLATLGILAYTAYKYSTENHQASRVPAELEKKANEAFKQVNNIVATPETQKEVEQFKNDFAKGEIKIETLQNVTNKVQNTLKDMPEKDVSKITEASKNLVITVAELTKAIEKLKPTKFAEKLDASRFSAASLGASKA
jgi:hypothetical protein